MSSPFYHGFLLWLIFVSITDGVPDVNNFFF
jgi:hypothetical protein